MERLKLTDLSLWEAFYALAKRSSFTAAARDLQLKVPHLSKKITKLEEELSLRLFNRTTRQVSLTSEGQNLVPQIEALLSSAVDIQSTLQRSTSASGLIRVSCLPAYAERCLAPALVRFQKAHPRISFEIYPSDQLVDIVNSQIDVAIRVQNPTGAQFVFRKILENEIVLCASPSYLKKFKPIRRVEDLKAHPLLMLSQHESCTFEKNKVKLKDLRRDRNLLCESGSVLTELAVNGAGVVARSLWDVAPLIQEAKLVRVLPKEKLSSFGYLYAVTPHRKLLSARLRLFIDFLVAEATNLRS